MPQTHDTERSGIETVVAELLRDVRALMRQEMVLAQHEVQYEIGKILKSVLWCRDCCGAGSDRIIRGRRGLCADPL